MNQAQFIYLACSWDACGLFTNTHTHSHRIVQLKKKDSCSICGSSVPTNLILYYHHTIKWQTAEDLSVPCPFFEYPRPGRLRVPYEISVNLKRAALEENSQCWQDAQGDVAVAERRGEGFLWSEWWCHVLRAFLSRGTAIDPFRAVVSLQQQY